MQKQQQTSFDINKWTSNDLIDYIKDHGGVFDDKKDKWSLEELKKQFYDLTNSDNNKNSGWFHTNNLKGESYLSSCGNSIYDWLFDSWDVSDLKKFLNENKINLDSNDKTTLLEALKKNSKKISDNLGTAGYYMSDKYLNSWSVDSLKNWLNKYKIKFDQQLDDKQKLVELVKANIYQVSENTQNQIYDFYKSLDLGQYSDLFNKDGAINADVFSRWSAQDLQRWLEYHDIALPKNKLDYNSLVSVASKHASLLKNDVNWYTEYSKDKASPIISKSKDQISDAWGYIRDKISNVNDDNVINDTFFVGLDSWPIERIKSFLNIRGVEYNKDSSKEELINLLKTNKNKKIIKGIKKNDGEQQVLSDLFKGWNLDNIKSWVGESVASGYDDIQDIIESGNNKLYDLIGVVKEKKDAVVTSVDQDNIKAIWEKTFDSWTNDDLKEYLKSFGVLPSSSRKDLIKKATDNTLLYLTGDRYTTSGRTSKGLFERIKSDLSGFTPKFVKNYLTNNTPWYNRIW
ncbi:double-strand break repair enhancer MSC1 SCDLUD_001306 [Saccharomycodes ludwigii]|uniref:double-strand break repair enhancer MSC1 n=1 Tax=Saccharomycodes ludwigii TaxID=36035 RepID=UPI001E891A22|nr:hypothetical protein SCDLUD_001306 [Saccharomycodes ludwigii]KAH3903658.1 hypothetical protein SCDLUD_001306 [Saccharomycodes ludwigii]